MKKLIVLSAMILACVCFAQTETTNTTIHTAISDNVKFNPMTREGKRRVLSEAYGNAFRRLATRYNCVISYCYDTENLLCGFTSCDKWTAGGEKGYIELDADHGMRRYSSDGRLVHVAKGELKMMVDEEAKLLRDKYLKYLGMTEDDAKKAAEKAEAHTGLLNLNRVGGLARLRMQRMEQEKKRLEAEEKRKKVEGDTKTIQEERAQKVAAEKQAQQATKEEEERKKFFPPLMPFADAVKKAKGGDGAALYSLALHYVNGEDISQDVEKARYCLKKASEVNYPAAVLFDAISKEDEIKGCGSRLNPETGLPHGRIVSFTEWRLREEKDPIKDTNAVEAVRIGYKKAASLGLTIATNELARFEKRIEEIREAMDIKEKNAVLAKALMTEYEKERAQKEAAAEKQLTAEERAKQRERLLQIQEQLRKQREEREEREAQQATKEEAERKKFFPPLMPFADAVRMAKGGDGAAMYALALHYAKGEEIGADGAKARQYLQKAADSGYPAAVLVNAMIQEHLMDKLDAFWGNGFPKNALEVPNTQVYTDIFTRNFVADMVLYDGRLIRPDELQNRKNGTRKVLSAMNPDDVAVVRRQYEKAVSLGISAATNELARFEMRISRITNANDTKKRNEALAKELP